MAGGPEAGVVLRQQARRRAEVGRHSYEVANGLGGRTGCGSGWGGCGGCGGLVGDGRRGPVSGVQPYVSP